MEPLKVTQPCKNGNAPRRCTLFFFRRRLLFRQAALTLSRPIPLDRTTAAVIRACCCPSVAPQHRLQPACRSYVGQSAPADLGFPDEVRSHASPAPFAVFLSTSGFGLSVELIGNRRLPTDGDRLSRLRSEECWPGCPVMRLIDNSPPTRMNATMTNIHIRRLVMTASFISLARTARLRQRVSIPHVVPVG